MLTDGSLASCYGNQRFSQLKPFLTALKMSVIGTFKWPENKQPLCSLALKQKAFSVSLGRKEERKQSKSWKSSVLREGKVLGPGFSLMGEAVGHFVTQMTQFGVIPWEHRGASGASQPLLGVSCRNCLGRAQSSAARARSAFVPRCAGIPELFLGMAEFLQPLALQQSSGSGRV